MNCILLLCYLFPFQGLFVLLEWHVLAWNVYIPPSSVESVTFSSWGFTWRFSDPIVPITSNEVCRDVWFRFVCIVVGSASVPAYKIQCLLRNPFYVQLFCQWNIPNFYPLWRSVVWLGKALTNLMILDCLLTKYLRWFVWGLVTTSSNGSLYVVKM